MTTKEKIQAAAYDTVANNLSVICTMLGISEYTGLQPVMERITELMKLAGGNVQELALLSVVEDAAKKLILSKTIPVHDLVSSDERAALQTALYELAKQRVLWNYVETSLDLKSQNSMANLLLDAIRYRAIRDQRNQLSEDDPCVSDSAFTTYFGKDLDRVADALSRRAIEVNLQQE